MFVYIEAADSAHEERHTRMGRRVCLFWGGLGLLRAGCLKGCRPCWPPEDIWFLFGGSNGAGSL